MYCHDILFIHHGRGKGGVQNNLARFWAAMDRSRFRPHLAYEYEGILSQRARELGIDSIRLKLPAWRKLLQRLRMGSCVKQLADYCKRKGIKLVIANDFWFAPHAILTSRRIDGKALAYVRVSDILSASKIKQYCLTQTDGILVPSQAYANNLHVVPGLDCKIRVIYNGFDIERFSRTANVEPACIYPADANILTVGVCGMISHTKGQMVLLKALKVLLGGKLPIRLLLVGGGKPDYMEVVLCWLKENDLEKHVHFAGEVTDVRPFLLDMDVFVLPSLRENFPLCVGEAMCMEVPVVHSDVGGVGELVGDAGLAFPVEDAEALALHLESLYHNPAERERLAAAGRERVVSNYSLQRQVDSIQQFYLDLLGG
jgi:glycosyltransferase involved in cell wall biosynthesis